MAGSVRGVRVAGSSRRRFLGRFTRLCAGGDAEGLLDQLFDRFDVVDGQRQRARDMDAAGEGGEIAMAAGVAEEIDGVPCPFDVDVIARTLHASTSEELPALAHELFDGLGAGGVCLDDQDRVGVRLAGLVDVGGDGERRVAELRRQRPEDAIAEGPGGAAAGAVLVEFVADMQGDDLDVGHVLDDGEDRLETLQRRSCFVVSTWPASLPGVGSGGGFREVFLGKWVRPAQLAESLAAPGDFGRAGNGAAATSAVVVGAIEAGGRHDPVSPKSKRPCRCIDCRKYRQLAHKHDQTLPIIAVYGPIVKLATVLDQ